MPVKAIVTFKAKEGVADGLQKNLSNVLENHTSTFKGYISGKVYRDQENSDNVVAIEEWETPQNFKDYLGSYSEEETAKMMEILTGPIEAVIIG